MFTGIVKHVGTVEAIEKSRYTFFAPAPFLRNLTVGSSVAVNGACLTITGEPRGRKFSVEVMPETKRRTMIHTLHVGDCVNVERSMSSQGFFDGHIIQGHVDGTAVISSIKSEGNAKVITLEVDGKLSRYMVEKGSVSINGISLTIATIGARTLTVAIVPHTWENTALRHVRMGDLVNVEVDPIAKYVEKFVGEKKAHRV